MPDWNISSELVLEIPKCYVEFEMWGWNFLCRELQRVHERLVKIMVLWLFNCTYTLQWRHNERNSVSNHLTHDCLLNRLFRRRSKKTSKLRVTGLCEGNSPVAGEFPAQRTSNAKNVSIWWRHLEFNSMCVMVCPWFSNKNTSYEQMLRTCVWIHSGLVRPYVDNLVNIGWVNAHQTGNVPLTFAEGYSQVSR